MTIKNVSGENRGDDDEIPLFFHNNISCKVIK